MFATQRHDQIQMLLRENGAVTIAGLMEAFNVSMETVRRDLATMEKAGLLVRVHGGALSPDATQSYHPLRERMQFQQSQKQAIARAAVKFVNEGDYIAIGAGSTALAFAQELRKHFRRLTVVTYSLDVLNTLRDLPEYTVMICGGTYTPSENSFVGPAAEAFLSEIYVQKAFIFPVMLSLEKGITNHVSPAPQMQMLVRQCDRVYVLADSSKFQKSSIYPVFPMREDFVYITANDMPQLLRRIYESNHLNFISAEE